MPFIVHSIPVINLSASDCFRFRAHKSREHHPKTSLIPTKYQVPAPAANIILQLISSVTLSDYGRWVLLYSKLFQARLVTYGKTLFICQMKETYKAVGR